MNLFSIFVFTRIWGYPFILFLNTYFVSRGVNEEKVLHVFLFFSFSIFPPAMPIPRAEKEESVCFDNEVFGVNETFG